jgi:hypothetical protein
MLGEHWTSSASSWDARGVTRNKAIARLVDADLAQLTVEARESLLLDYWSMDEDDEGYDSLPHELRDELAQREEPGEAASAHYNPLLKLALRHKYVGVLNSFLQAALVRLGEAADRVEGQIEPMATCPCCLYQSIEERGQYFICKVCFWEDDGSDEPNHYSGPNHMTLAEARNNFQRLGAVSEAAMRSVLSDGRLRYALSNRS